MRQSKYQRDLDAIERAVDCTYREKDVTILAGAVFALLTLERERSSWRGRLKRLLRR